MRARRGLHRVCGQQTFLLCALPSREDPRLPQGHQLPSRRVGGGKRPRSWTLGSVSSGLISKHIFLLGLDDLADSNRLCFPFPSAGSVASAGSLVLFLLPGSEARGPFPPAALEAPLWLCRLLFTWTLLGSAAFVLLLRPRSSAPCRGWTASVTLGT